MTAGTLESPEVRDRVAPAVVFDQAWAHHELGEGAVFSTDPRLGDSADRHLENYGVRGAATAEERTLLRVAAVGILLFIIIGGMALSQYVIYLFARASNF
jgi:hypothetical protein